MPRIRVVLADDHRLVLEAVQAMLEDDGDFDVVAVAESARQLLPQVAQKAPDVVVLDVAMPGTDGFACLREIREKHPRVKVVMLSGHDEPRIAHRALRLGASAYVRKQVDPRDLASVLRQAVEETVASQPAALQENAEADDAAALLTVSELAVLRALARGLVNKQIAADLQIAPQTVKFHLTNVYRKLGVANRTEAVRFAFQRELVEPELVSV
ncbi:MAG TPA: response regulator transcription factor [Gaiellaceae bacterium]|nr:response regulator transcription factor [Gaiellaceae bacterium]